MILNKRKQRMILLGLLILMVLLMLTGCVPGDGTSKVDKPAGFFWGVWHGWIAPISLIIGIFDKKVRIYEVFNNGWWYDLGFYVAIISGFGGISLSRKKRSRKKEN
jgi:hypothetical protein